MLPLYKQTKQGKVQYWKVNVVGNKYIVEQGQVNTTSPQFYETICTPKNIGKANETTAEQQAILEATALHLKQQERKGYTTDPSGIVEQQYPMKISTYDKSGHNLIYPIAATRKLNGVNATYNADLTLTSRTNTLYPPQPHLTEQIKAAMDKLGTSKLAGELYHHGSSLQTIVSLVKKPKPESANLVFYIFDLPEVEGAYEERMQVLATLPTDLPNVKACLPTYLNSESDIINLHTEVVAEGYEGLVLHNLTSKYVYNIRSTESMKYKLALSSEFRIVDMNLDKTNQPVLVLQTNPGKQFKAKPIGTVEERQTIVSTFTSAYLNNWGTIEYEMLSDDGIPLKPVFISLRNCTEKGEPIE